MRSQRHSKQHVFVAVVVAMHHRMGARASLFFGFPPNFRNPRHFGVVSSLSRASSSSPILIRLRAGNQEKERGDDNDVQEPGKQVTKNDSDGEEKVTKDIEISPPIVVAVRAKFGRQETILDQNLKLDMRRHRSIGFLKDSLRRTLPLKPPVSLMQILFEGHVVADNVLLDTLLKEQQEDNIEDESSSEDDSNDILNLTLDMIPPVQEKFLETLEKRLKEVTTAELLRLYANNEAALYETSLALFEEEKIPRNDEGEESPNNEGEEGDTDGERNTMETRPLVTPRVEERANNIERRLKDMLLKDNDEKIKSILAETRPPSAIEEANEVRGERAMKTVRGGLSASLQKRLLGAFIVQSWSETLRYMCLLIFFGLFGGRTPMARAVLLLGAPSVLLLQARPVKRLWKEILYFLIDNPPAIVLSLLPAPQQVMLRLDRERSMQTIYGSYTTETKDLFDKARGHQRRFDNQVSENGDEDLIEADEDEFFDTQQRDNDDDDDDGDDDGNDEDFEEDDDFDDEEDDDEDE